MRGHNLHSTDKLIQAYTRDDEFDGSLLDAVIPAAIDALYEARDQEFSMHGAGAAVAVEVLRRLGEIVDLTVALPSGTVVLDYSTEDTAPSPHYRE